MAVTAPARAAPEVVWEPFGSQRLVLTCPAYECLYRGNRGPGKTDAMLMDFGQHVGQGFGADWRGVLFRREYKNLEEVVVKSKKWFRRIWPRAVFLESKGDYKWKWPTGEELLFRAIKRPDDYWNFHGHELPWQGWDDLTTWPDLSLYHRMKSCCRSSNADVPLKIRSTANPYGPGHAAVKTYFVDAGPPGKILEDEHGLTRSSIRGHRDENPYLPPNYAAIIAQAARSEAEKEAWLHENWDIVAGGMFDDVWDRDVHVIAPFRIPKSWRVDRAFDWGSSHPFSVGWWAESDGTTAPNGRTYPRGTLFRIGEWYGSTGEPNVGLRMQDTDIALGILEREGHLPLDDGMRVRPGPADTQIFDADPGRETIADRMAKKGVRWTRADKRPGSRKQGWEAARGRFRAALDPLSDEPAAYIFDTCTEFIRTVPTLPRDLNRNNPDDVDTDAEDHAGDEFRYRIFARRGDAGVETFSI